MSEKLYPVPAEWAKRAWVDDAKYQELYARSVKDPNAFLGRDGSSRLDWIKPYTKVKDASLRPCDNVSIQWFEDGTLNVCANCVDRHRQNPGRSGRDHLGGRRPDRRREDHVPRSCLSAFRNSPMS